MQYSSDERKYYNQYRLNACDRLSISKLKYNQFRRLGEALHRIYENDCNGLYESEDASEQAATPLYAKVFKLINNNHPCLFVYYQTDPRGATIYLDTQPIKRDSYNNAVCIY
jgi:hypothetical protein